MNKKILLLVTLLIAITFILLLSINKKPVSKSAPQQNSFTIVTSFYPLAHAIEKIIADTGVVINIGEGRDPHDYQPSVQDIQKLHTADLVVLQGFDFEPWGSDVQKQLKSKVPVIIAGNAVALRKTDHHEEENDHVDHNDHRMHSDEETHHDHNKDFHSDHAHGMYDPHTWVSPLRYIQTVEYLRDQIILQRPDFSSEYTANTELFIKKLESLSQEYEQQLARCSYTEVIVSHDAFGYLATDYRFKTHAIAGLSTQDTPSISTLTKLKNKAASGNIGAILVEENSISAYSETLAKETGLPVFTINPIAFNIPADHNYLSMSRSNLNSLVQALQCS